MTEVKPATDEEIAALKGGGGSFLGYLWSDVAKNLIARIEADRVKIARLEERNYAEAMRDRLDYEARVKRVEVEKDAEIARLKAEAGQLREAIGLLSTLHPAMVMDPANPVGMAQEIHAHVTTEQARFKAEVSE